MLQFSNLEGPKVKFDHVLLHEAMIACDMPDQSICKKFEWVLFSEFAHTF